MAAKCSIHSDIRTDAGLISLPDELVLGVGLADLPLLPAFAPVVAFADRGSDGNV